MGSSCNISVKKVELRGWQSLCKDTWHLSRAKASNECQKRDLALQTKKMLPVASLDVCFQMAGHAFEPSAFIHVSKASTNVCQSTLNWVIQVPSRAPLPHCSTMKIMQSSSNIDHCTSPSSMDLAELQHSLKKSIKAIQSVIGLSSLRLAVGHAWAAKSMLLQTFSTVENWSRLNQSEQPIQETGCGWLVHDHLSKG